MELRSASEALLRNAIRYAEHGWPVFLLGRTKRPLANCDACRDAGSDHDPAACDCLTCHGFYAATTDPDRIEAMVSWNPGSMLAIRTGAPSGTVVIDIDPGHGGRVDPALMPETACVATGSGGWHLYYLHPGTAVLCSQGRVADGIDVRADGGYVVAPPSIHPRTGRPYRWTGGRSLVEMPPALVEACRPNETTPVTASANVAQMRSAGGISSPEALLKSHLDAVARAPKGKRRSTLYGAARGVARMVGGGALTEADALAALTDVGFAAGQSEREVRGAITGAFRDERVPITGIAA
ncbi:bifunctional DNA primase/polymerase [Dactylosporangium fulvum]|uniref:Bifunctional DNA primase/polymerase n=1 Tax=Dactylosporangium fulvum TaxID=53359 RepID=A0ABY5W325_9ACTN|nr:bifunctional DNA primase/polymerase [Dactylosporangium fulvum]UWP83922.1 bifunctional DNA primase/polymerase [Dactylosporangium fulvum]